MDSVLKVFEGLTLSQVKQLRRRIIETLPQLRREVTGTVQASQNDSNGRNGNRCTEFFAYKANGVKTNDE
jgi:hypothetical protein